MEIYGTRIGTPISGTIGATGGCQIPRLPKSLTQTIGRSRAHFPLVSLRESSQLWKLGPSREKG